jgi:kumamolisin
VKIAVYFAPFTERGWVDVLTTAVHDSQNRPSVISISWGYTEGQMIWTQQAINAVNQALQAAAAMGVTVICAAGDDGSRDQDSDGHAHVDFPASSPYILACGGTTLRSANNQITSEIVWNNGPSTGGATGGGISDMNPLPSWQASASVPPSVNPPGTHVGRGVPDIAGNANQLTGYQIRVDGTDIPSIGGTSAVAPLWAGLIALINQALGTPVGYFNPLLYTKLGPAGVCRDITSGNNDITGHIGGYPAHPGWDACTGWGSPDGAKLLSALQ